MAVSNFPTQELDIIPKGLWFYQIVRDLMRPYIAEGETPNALSASTLRKSAAGEDIFYAAGATDLFKQLGI